MNGAPADAAAAVVGAELDGVRAATSEAADLLGDPDRGVLRAGAIADVLAVDGDVLGDVRALSRPAALFKSGRQVR